MVAIGIDLGSVFSCIGVFQQCQLHVNAATIGSRVSPIYIPLANSKYLWHFKINSSVGGQFEADGDWQGGHKEITTVVLKELRETAESYIGQEVTEAVITVPAFFDDEQRQITVEAGAVAGLRILAIINDSTAASLSYRLTNNLKSERNVLIFNLGGCNLDVLVLTVDESARFEVRAMSGDRRLADSFDIRLITHLVNEFRFKHKKDLTSNTIALSRLRTAAECVKRSLSSCAEVTIEIDELFEGLDFTTKITRDMFEELCADLFAQILIPVEKALHTANMDKNLLDDIVLVGCSTGFPKIQNLLQQYFNGKRFNTTINPDEAVAYGAAVLAALLSADNRSSITDVLLLNNAALENFAPLSLGIETAGGVVTKIIERNSRMPCKRSQIFSTYADNQTGITILVYEGERLMSKDNNLLGRFDMYGVPPGLRGVPQIEVTFELDVNGVFTISAKELRSGNTQYFHVKNYNGRLSQTHIQKIVNEAEKYAEEDCKLKENITIRNSLESFAYAGKQILGDCGDKVSQQEKYEVMQACEDTIKWLRENSQADMEVYKIGMDSLKRFTMPVLSKLLNSGDAGGDIHGGVDATDVTGDGSGDIVGSAVGGIAPDADNIADVSVCREAAGGHSLGGDAVGGDVAFGNAAAGNVSGEVACNDVACGIDGANFVAAVGCVGDVGNVEGDVDVDVDDGHEGVVRDEGVASDGNVDGYRSSTSSSNSISNISSGSSYRDFYSEATSSTENYYSEDEIV